MSGILDLLNQQLSGAAVQQMSSQLGADPESTQKALSAALPMLVGGLARNAQSPEGAQSLANALDRDHDGSLIDGFAGLLGGASGGSGGGLGALLGGASGGRGGLGALLGGASGGSSGGGLEELLGGLMGGGAPAGKTTDGEGILGHILGNKRGAVEQGVARSSGLDAGTVGKLLPMLAPLVMGALGRAKKEQNLDAGGLASMLNQERSRVEHDTPGMQEGGLLGMLDMDDDGDITDDVAKLGGMLGSFFSK